MNITKKAGFTLAETMIGMTIGLAIAGSAGYFLVEGTRISLKTSSASTSDLAEWGVLTSITVDTKTANGMVMYSDFLKATVSNSANRLKSGERGNVLILTQSTPSSTASAATFQQLTGYVFDASYKNIRRFTYKVKPSEQTTPDALETIINNNYDTLVFAEIAASVTAVSPTTPPLDKAFLCRNAGGQSGELNVQVSGGSAALLTSNTKIIETSFYIRG